MVGMKFTTNRATVEHQTREAIKRGMRDAGMVWHGDATRITPVDTGNLRASLQWIVENSRIRLGTNLDYAVIVHEDLNAHHSVGQAKFIESPLRENRDKYVRLIADVARREMQ